MRKQLLFLLLFFSVSTAFSQVVIRRVVPVVPSLPKDTLFPKPGNDPMRKLDKRFVLPPDHMPNLAPANRLSMLDFEGRNDYGFDVYRSKIDNMAVIMPGSDYVSNMPVKNYTPIQDTKPGIVEPPRDSDSPAILNPMFRNYRKVEKIPLLKP